MIRITVPLKSDQSVVSRARRICQVRVHAQRLTCAPPPIRKLLLDMSISKRDNLLLNERSPQ